MSFGGFTGLDQQIRYLVEVAGLEGLQELLRMQQQEADNTATLIDLMNRREIAVRDGVTSISASIQAHDRITKAIGLQTEEMRKLLAADEEYARLQKTLGQADANDLRAQRLAAVEDLNRANRENTQAIREQIQAEKEWAALQAALGAMDDRDARSARLDEEAARLERLNSIRQANVAQTRDVVAARKAEVLSHEEVGKEVDNEIRRLEALLQVEQTAARVKVDKAVPALQKVERGYYNWGTTVLFASQAIEDFQYSFAAVVNNLGLLTMSIGTQMGFTRNAAMLAAGGIGVAGVAISQLINHWDEVKEKLGLGFPPKLFEDIESLKKHLSEIEKKKDMKLIDVEAVEVAKRAVSDLEEKIGAFNAARRSQEQTDLGGMATSAVRDSVGSKALLRSVMLALQKDAGFREEMSQTTEQTALDQARAQFRSAAAAVAGAQAGDPGSQALAERSKAVIADLNVQIPILEKRVRDLMVQRSKEFMGEFMLGDVGAVKGMQGLTAANPNLFPAPFRRDVASLPSAPGWKDAIEQEESEERAQQIRVEGNKFIRDLRRDQAKKQNEKDLEVSRTVQDLKLVAKQKEETAALEASRISTDIQVTAKAAEDKAAKAAARQKNKDDLEVSRTVADLKKVEAKEAPRKALANDFMTNPRFGGHGQPNQAQADAMAHRTLQLMKQGFDVISSQTAAYQEMGQHILRMQMQLNGIRGNLNSARNRMRMRQQNFNPNP